jgi:hypothetical protein
MSSPYQQLVSSPVLGATTAAAVMVGAAYYMYSQRQGGRCPVKQKEGKVEVLDMHASPDERRRDFFRFLKSRSIYVKSGSGEVSLFKGSGESPDAAVRDLVKLLPKGTDIDALIYSLSTSLGMEVLLKLGVMPPMISQPVFVVHTNSGDVDLFGFIGDNVRGDNGPDSKFTDWFVQITVCSNAKKKVSEVRYHVKPRPDNCTRTSDFI